MYIVPTFLIRLSFSQAVIIKVIDKIFSQQRTSRPSVLVYIEEYMVRQLSELKLTTQVDIISFS